MPVGNDVFGDEAYFMLADDEGPEAAQAAVAYVRQQRRLRGEPTMSRKEAVLRANEHLRAEGSPCGADMESALPNGRKDLWILHCHDPRHPDQMLDGGELVVTASGEVYRLSSAPDQAETAGVTFPTNQEEGCMLPEDWKTVLSDALSTEQWNRLMEFVERERQQGTVYPPPDQVFRALQLTPYSDVRVVILGQDPYHGPDQAHGLCFSVAQGTYPPSLRKILAELQSDLGCVPPEGGNLENWARQGVLLLNTVLTVRAGEANSHRGQGWEEFTNAIIRSLNEKPERVVFLLWGGAARKAKRLVTNPQHKVLEAAHPAARPNAHQKFVGSRPFSRANTELSGSPYAPIEWGREDSINALR